jgi:peptide/nickel transport system substrate-binding protein
MTAVTRILRRLTGAALCLAAVCGLPGMPAQARDQLVIGISQFPDNFNPKINSMAAKSYILAMARRPVTTFDADWNLICMLCTELPSMEKGTARYEKTKDGKDGVAVTYTLRPDARWGDGTPITTKDVVLSWQIGKHPVSGVSNAEFYRRIDRIEVKDDHTFTLHKNKRTCTFANANDFHIVPAHLEKPNFKDPKAYRSRSAYESDTTNPGLWFGPYRVAEVSPGSHVILERNPTWWGRKPAFDRVIVKVIQNTSAMTANLLAGGIDYVAGEVGMSLDQAMALKGRHGDRFNFVFKPSLVYEHIDVNLDNPILADRRVRRALLYAIDRKAISTQLFDGYQPVANSSINPLDLVYSANTKRYPLDREKAAKLLDAAGWRLRDNGIRYNAKGERLQLLIMTTAGNKTRELVQQVLQSNWRQVGIDMRIRNEPARVFFGSTVRRRKFSGLAMYAWLSSPQNVPRGQLHSEEIPSAEGGWSGQNYPGLRSPAFDTVLDSLETQCEPQENMRLWHELQKLYMEELPALPLYFRAQPHIMPKWLKGVRPTGHQYSSSLWIEDWTVGK